MATDETCVHPGCNCTAAEGSDYCSDECSHAQDTVTELACACGHEACAG
jgi:hypothetical protein